MFTADQSITDLKVRERGIFKALYSLNIHQVATPELGVEDARCYVLFFGEGNNATAYIAIYLTRSDRRIFYSYSSNPFPQEMAAQVQEEARGFVEDMGFVLDEVSLAGMSPSEKNRWIDEQDIFNTQKKQSEAPAAAPPATAQPKQWQPPAAEPQARQWQPPGPQAQETKPASGPMVFQEIKREERVHHPEAKTGAAKPVAPQSGQATPETAATVSREREALARLLASF